MYEKISEILLNYVEEPEGGLTPELKFIDDLEMNSLDIMTMIGDLEDEFNITIETSELRDLYTLQDLVNYLEKKV
ncbi:MAG: acyl carrier protein [Oscillospiraceae bacterium]|jgi:acyl carrier protein|nr:acyl carrier protein [Oscillospiraceae bacterium]